MQAALRSLCALLYCLQDIRKRINSIPPLGKVAHFVAIPTTSGTGSEVTPFAVVTDEHTGIKYPLADYALVSLLLLLL
jgi:acetaldehyde dehydrogenase/alcohol dehydrogenase